ncbi:MAG: hypothetical protein GY803_30775 [Chloroflexi bacterium]|nr:hypothetical protein [Chloroflexota bacterium]
MDNQRIKRAIVKRLFLPVVIALVLGAVLLSPLDAMAQDGNYDPLPEGFSYVVPEQIHIWHDAPADAITICDTGVDWAECSTDYSYHWGARVTYGYSATLPAWVDPANVVGFAANLTYVAWYYPGDGTIVEGDSVGLEFGYTGYTTALNVGGYQEFGVSGSGVDGYISSPIKGSYWSGADMLFVANTKSASRINSETTYRLEDMRVIVYGTPPEPEPLADWGASCAFTTTITDTNGITTTTTYTRAANIVVNPSFEFSSNGYTPDHWQPAKAGAQTNPPPFYQANAPTLANSGSASVFDGSQFELHSSLPLFAGGSYAAGFHARCVGSPCPDSAATLLWGAIPVVSSGVVDSTYRAYTDTITTGGGGQLLVMRFDVGSDIVHVDDVFVYPVDENGDLNCDPAFYEPYNPITDNGGNDDDNTTIVGGVPAPIGAAGVTCYYCMTPNSLSASTVAYWIAWLGCVFRNMFSCSLRVWLMKVGNWTAGVVQILLAFMTWTPAMEQGAANWIAEQVIPALSIVVVGGGDAAANGWDVLVSLVNLVETFINSITALVLEVIELLAAVVVQLSGLLVSIVQMVVMLITALRSIFTVDPYQFNLNGIETPDAGALGAAGPNDNKILYLFMIGIGVMDTWIGSNGELFALAVGVAALFVVIWTVREWRQGLV